MKTAEQKWINTQKLPLLIEADQSFSFDDFTQYLQSNKSEFKKHLLQYGGLLFRGFPVETADDFSKSIEALGLGSFVNYIGGGSPRSKVEKSVYTSTEAPPSIKIHLHNEMSFAKNFPKHIYFWCDIPPEQGGETFIGDSREILKKVDPSVLNPLKEKGINYVSRYYYKSKFMDLFNKLQKGHKSWVDVMETDDPKEAEKRCRENDIRYRWLSGQWLEISRIRPATHVHPETNDPVWFNQVHLFDYNPRFLGYWKYLGMRMAYCRKDRLVDDVFYGDHTKIPREHIYHIHDVLDEQSIYFPWQKGDMLVLDNILSMHARAPFKGKRRILTAMTS